MTRLAPALLAMLMAAGGCEGPSRPAEDDNVSVKGNTHWHVEADSLYAATGYRWHLAIPGESVQFGLPETDDRAFRIDCRNGRIALIGPAATEAGEGSPIEVTFDHGDLRTGSVALFGDGSNFVVEVAPDDPLLPRLLGRRHIVVQVADDERSIPTAGGVDLIRALIRNCR